MLLSHRTKSHSIQCFELWNVFSIICKTFVRVFGYFSCSFRNMGKYKCKTQRGFIDSKALARAIEAVRINNATIFAASEAYNIPISSLTRYLCKFDAVVPNASDITEEQLITVVENFETFGKSTVFTVDFCIICMDSLPKKLIPNNSIECFECKRPVHLKCAKMTSSVFVCKNCDTDD